MWSHLIMNHPLPITINGLRKPSPMGRFMAVGFNSSSVAENYSRFHVWRWAKYRLYMTFAGAILVWKRQERLWSHNFLSRTHMCSCFEIGYPKTAWFRQPLFWFTPPIIQHSHLGWPCIVDLQFRRVIFHGTVPNSPNVCQHFHSHQILTVWKS